MPDEDNKFVISLVSDFRDDEVTCKPRIRNFMHLFTKEVLKVYPYGLIRQKMETTFFTQLNSTDNL